VSKFLTFNDICFTNKEALIAALAEVGFPDVEVGDEMHLYGYHGDVRPETADIVVRRKHIGYSSNDLGFTKTEKGYVPIISDYDKTGRLGQQWRANLQTAYNERSVKTIAQKLRGSVKREQVGGTIRLRVRY
jgi:hypothetical protein